MLVSTGYDAHVDDPIGNLAVSDEIFSWMTEVVLDWADTHADGRLISVLEGGYNLSVLSRCAGEHARLMAARG